jgi:hypothetical protein
MEFNNLMKRIYYLVYCLLITTVLIGCAHWTITDKLITTKTLKDGTFLKTEHKEKQSSISTFDKKTHNMLVDKISTI